MTKDRSERKTYRKSPGRQYGYEYDPLHNQNSSGYYPAERSESSLGESPSRAGMQSAPRPDLRRTRQLLRQNILASKSQTLHPEEDDTEQEEFTVPRRRAWGATGEQQDDSALYSDRYNARRNRGAQHIAPGSQRLRGTGNLEEPPLEEEWNEFDFVDPDIGYEDPLDQRVNFPEVYPVRSVANPPALRRIDAEVVPVRKTVRDSAVKVKPEELDEEDLRAIKRRKKKQGVSRRRLLTGIGIVAAGGAVAVAAYEIAPNLPKSVGDVVSNTEKQIQDAFNQGVASGANAVRKEFINELETLEGVSLDAAIGAAHLTRAAYDTFVSPLVTLAATITGDFLNITLRALKTGRYWLSTIGQDNSYLQALQTVLETWVKQVVNMPKQIQSITDTDLDGAQSYLRALKQKIQDEQNKLNSSGTTPTTTPGSGASPTANPGASATPTQ